MTLVASMAAGATSLAPKSLSTGELQIALDKLNVLGSVLYVAAHPDDESTALLAYLARGRLARTAYLSLTRGDGGQNLLGTELGAELGLIRSQELLQARAIDGAEQLFTRAVDFGYTKSVEEALEVWGHEQVLADVVRLVRRFQPDVIVTRFPGDGRGGHGQHVASGALALEAFSAAADRERFSDQLGSPEFLQPWQAKRLLWDAARFFGGGEEPAEDLFVDVGSYSAQLGLSFTEVAALSRSMHKSQGFGSSGSRGRRINRFEHQLGEPVRGRSETDRVFPDPLFDGIDISWRRVPGGAEVGDLLARAAETFDSRQPAAVASLLLQADGLLADLIEETPESVWLVHKRTELRETLRAMLGLWIEAVADRKWAIAGERIAMRLAAVQRSEIPVRLVRVEAPFGAPLSPDLALGSNEAWSEQIDVGIPPAHSPTEPYWLTESPDGALYRVDDPRRIGSPEQFPLEIRFVLEVAGREIDYQVPLLYRWTDRIEGERYRVFQVAPALSVAVEPEVLVFAGPDAKTVTVTLESLGSAGRDAGNEGDEPVSGDLRLQLPEGWSVRPDRQSFLLEPGAASRFEMAIVPPARPSSGGLTVEARLTGSVDGDSPTFDAEVREIDYRHIPPQTLLQPARARLVRVELERRGQTVGYVPGAGDEIPQALRQVGYDVVVLDDQDLASGDLASYDAIVVGVRAYNARPAVERYNQRLLDYVEQGGTLVVQYNTAPRRGAGPTHIGPYPFRISRHRVSVESAPVSLLVPDHPVLTAPNRIGIADFENWVQERGLYFADQWDPRFSPLLAANDPGEDPREGGLLYAHYGKGVYIYTGYSFFRELPAGVSGAYRLFINLISARQSTAPAP